MSRNVVLGMINVLLRQQPMAERRRDLAHLVDEAGRSGCKIVLLPEFADHHCTKEGNAAGKLANPAHHKTLGLRIDSPWMRALAALARRHRMVVIPDVMLLEGSHATNTAVVFGPDGGVLGRYTKAHLAPGENKRVAPGDSIDAIATPFGKIGIFICWDINFPEMTRIYELLGADIILWSTMRQVESEDVLWRSVLPARCFEHSMPLGVATYVTEHQAPTRKPMMSTVFNAFGQVVAGGLLSQGVVRGAVDLDVRPVTRRYWGRPDWVDAGRYYRRYRRPDLYGAIVKRLASAERDPDKEAKARDYPRLVDPVL